MNQICVRSIQSQENVLEQQPSIYMDTHTQVKTHIFHLLFEADVDFIAFGQSCLELIKLLTIQGQLWLERKVDKSES